jgi:hypothetical protein
MTLCAEQALIGTGGGNFAYSLSSVVLGGGGNVAGDAGDTSISYSTVLGGSGNTASGRQLVVVLVECVSNDVVTCEMF